MSSPASGGMETWLVPGCDPHSGRFSSRPSRPVATTSSDACLLALASRCSSRSRNVSSPLWASSMMTTTGRRIASASRYLRAAQNTSVTGNALVEQADDRGQPLEDVVLAGDAVDGRAELGQRALGRVVVDDPGGARGPSRSSGQNVMPSPYGRQRPRRTVARSMSSPRNVSTRCDLPTPASPTTVTIRHPPSVATSVRASWSWPDLLVAAHQRRLLGAALRDGGRVADGDQPVGRDALRLALELERLDGLDLDLAAHQAVGEVADEDLVRGRRLLQPGRDVDRVAGRQPLLRVGVDVGDDLAGVDAGPGRDLDAVELEQLAVQPLHAPGSCRAPRGPRAARRPRGPAGGRTRP